MAHVIGREPERWQERIIGGVAHGFALLYDRPVKFLPIGLLLLLSSLALAQTPAPPLAETQKWVATLDATWQETYAKEVTAPFDAEMAKLAQQYLAAVDASAQKSATAGDLDQTVQWRAERERFALAKDVPAEDEATAPAALKQLRVSWRTQAARLQADRATHARAVLARYDTVLAQAQKQLTQAQRIDEALLLKKQREDVAARWTPAATPAPPVATTTVAPARPATPPVAGKSPATPPAATSMSKTAKLTPREVMEKLLAAGVQVKIGEYRSQKEIREVGEAPEKFAFYSLGFHPRKDGVPVTDDDLALLDHIPALRALALDGIDVTDAGLEHLRGLRILQYLELKNLPKVAGPGLKVLNDMPSVETLKLFSLSAAEATIKAVAATKHLPHLIMGTMEIPEGALAALGTNTTMSNLDFETGATGLTAAGLGQLAKMRKLTQLYVAETPIDDAMAAEIGKMEGLQHLNIRQSRLTEAGVVSLGRLRNLTNLTLPAPPATPAALAALKKLKALKDMTVGKTMPAEDLAKLRAALKTVSVKE
jgi:hypothetical protein